MFHEFTAILDLKILKIFQTKRNHLECIMVEGLKTVKHLNRIARNYVKL